eukprot:CAMPEP_0115520534 /NCGR_PEP_ID=MMETSP0271-20121206/79042_1 /TAXON_ID=71861 /ORGANISM="Scrippsiella trochoidea, Strain CCMP3099" /LENGTH=36 /DNA_ID= /DNA_START= /DNA_END= /DNA_ORIENTATION=
MTKPPKPASLEADELQPSWDAALAPASWLAKYLLRA